MRALRWVAPLLVVLAGTTAVAAADSMNVIVAPGTDFGAFRTFTFRVYQVKSPRPEIDNRLFEKHLVRRIRTALVERGLVDIGLTSEDIATTQRGGGRGSGPQPLRFTVATLVIDMSAPGTTQPAWRGVYREEEPNGSKLVEKLPGDAVKLIGEYPKRRR